MKNIQYISFIIVTMILSCNTKSKPTNQIPKDPLPSFNISEAKNNITEFVSRVTDSTSKDFVNKKDRIAVFDNDGTLWVEQPLPSQIFFAFDRIKELAEVNLEWNNDMPFKAIIENDTKAINDFTEEDLVKIVGEAHATNNVNEFDTIVQNWLGAAKHPILKKSYTQLVYQPMLELMDYLRVNDFNIYIVSGGSQEFMRAWVPEAYGVPKRNIIGSTFKRVTVEKDTTIAVAQTAKFEFYDDHEGKVVSIDRFIGQKPIMVVGNSDGDLEMMEYSDTENQYPTLMIYLDHTDGDREILYNDDMPAGILIKGREVAKERGWTVIDMKTDWKTVFPKP